MAYTITLNGTALAYLPKPDDYGKSLFLAGPAPARAIDHTLVPLGNTVKRRWDLILYIGEQLAFLEGLLALSSFIFVDHDGASYTVKATGLRENSWPLEEVGTAQLTLEEV